MVAHPERGREGERGRKERGGKEREGEKIVREREKKERERVRRNKRKKTSIIAVLVNNSLFLSLSDYLSSQLPE